jgi:glycosyltransferase involved in cell wall biosynthesis
MLVKPLGALAAQFAGVPCVLHVRNIHETLPATSFYGAIARLPSVKRIIANSSASAVPYRRVAAEKVRVVHNGIDLSEYDRKTVGRGRFRHAHGLQTATLVGFTGNLIPRKGLVPLIKAAAKVLPGRPEVRFVVLGRVPVGMAVDHLAEYRALVEALGIAERFLFAGFEEDVRAAVADFDILVLPSFQEPFGRSIIEAMALHTPVVATSVGGIPEVIVDGQHGLLVAPGDVDALAEAIGSLIDSPARRERLAKAARERVEERFDVARLTGDIEALFTEAIQA